MVKDVGHLIRSSLKNRNIVIAGIPTFFVGRRSNLPKNESCVYRKYLAMIFQVFEKESPENIEGGKNENIISFRIN